MGFDTHPETINRKGRPKKGTTLTDILMKKLPKEEFIEALINLAIKDKNITAFKEIMERLDGKVKDVLDIDVSLFEEQITKFKEIAREKQDKLNESDK